MRRGPLPRATRDGATPPRATPPSPAPPPRAQRARASDCLNGPSRPHAAHRSCAQAARQRAKRTRSVRTAGAAEAFWEGAMAVALAALAAAEVQADAARVGGSAESATARRALARATVDGAGTLAEAETIAGAAEPGVVGLAATVEGRTTSVVEPGRTRARGTSPVPRSARSAIRGSASRAAAAATMHRVLRPPRVPRREIQYRRTRHRPSSNTCMPTKRCRRIRVRARLGATMPWTRWQSACRPHRRASQSSDWRFRR